MLLNVERTGIDPLEDALLRYEFLPELADEVCYDQKETWERNRYGVCHPSVKHCYLGKPRGFEV